MRWAWRRRCRWSRRSAERTSERPNSPTSAYFDNSEHDDVVSGGVKMVPIATSKGTFKVWTRRVGNNPRVKVLLLHGGPAATHEYFEAFDSFLPGAGVEYYYYDQLGSAYSDQPDDDSLWELPRFVDEVEQVRAALHLDRNNFYLLGHSWGGLLAIEPHGDVRRSESVFRRAAQVHRRRRRRSVPLSV